MFAIYTHMKLIIYSFLLVNFIAFGLIGYDKHLAKRHKQRISERTLLSFVFFGGTIGSGLGMLFFRHKTSKNSYLWKFWGIVFLQTVLAYLAFRFELFSL